MADGSQAAATYAGKDNEYVFGELLGMSSQQIADLVERNVIHERGRRTSSARPRPAPRLAPNARAKAHKAKRSRVGRPQGVRR